MTGYYSQKLSGRRLQHCYALASTRVQQYLEAEVQHVLSRVNATDTVLELGCGYGRVALRLAEVAKRVVGIYFAAVAVACAQPGHRRTADHIPARCR